MNWNPRRDRIFVLAAFALVWLAGFATPAFAQDRTQLPLTTRPRPAAEKWRPMDGVYAYPDKDFVANCEEGGYLGIELAKKRVSGNEWGCDITKITGMASGAIGLDLTCNDYNLAEAIKAPESMRFKEIMLLNKIDQTSMFVRKTSNGKFRYSRWQASYCPDEQQRIFAGIQPEPWLSRDGVYASPGADFEDRCLKSDSVIDLAGKSISSGADHCDVYSRIDPEPGNALMTVICNETGHTKGQVVVRYIDDLHRG